MWVNVRGPRYGRGHRRRWQLRKGEGEKDVMEIKETRQVINENKPSMITFDEVNQSEAQLEHSSPQRVESSIDPTDKDNVIARTNMIVRNV